MYGDELTLGKIWVIQNPKAGKRDIPLAPIVVNTLRQRSALCPKGELGLVFPNGVGNIETLPNIFKRCWKPLQLKCELTIDTGKKDLEGKPFLRPATASTCSAMQLRASLLPT
jgi:hypothetical protein